ncbi:MAG TPA: TIGR02996 domain-containing protein [Gemmata sp.]
MSFSDRDALLAAITADPDEDTPRLVYADWLSEHGEDDHAELIRSQCRLEHVSRRTAEGKRLAAREKELCTKLFGHLDTLGFSEVNFRRGFVAQVTSGALDFHAHAAALTAEIAPAFGLKLEESARDKDMRDDDYEAHDAMFGAAADRAETRRCVSLDLPCIGMAAMHQLLSAPQWVNLRRLNAPQSEAGPSFYQLNSPTFANLRWLNISESNSAGGDARIWGFTDNTHLANLEYLDFRSNLLEGDDAHRLNESRCLTNLRVLYASGGSYLNGGTVSWLLFRGRGLPRLQELSLSHEFPDLEDFYFDIDDDSGHGLDDRSPPLLTRLSKLRLQHNQITDAGAEVLARYPRAVNLTLLDLTGNPIGADGRRALIERFGPGVCVFEGGDR